MNTLFLDKKNKTKNLQMSEDKYTITVEVSVFWIINALAYV